MDTIVYVDAELTEIQRTFLDYIYEHYGYNDVETLKTILAHDIPMGRQYIYEVLKVLQAKGIVEVNKTRHSFKIIPENESIKN